jgi:predicted nicotinamide N-methyase
MNFSLHPEKFTIGSHQYELLVPDPEQVRQLYNDGKIEFPYWSKIWPSSIALAGFIDDNPYLVKGKNVTELAAGLGLPSFVSSRYATTVTCTDMDPDAVSVMATTIQNFNYTNCTALRIDWQDLPGKPEAEIILMSDVNYEPSAFEALYKCFLQLLNHGKTIVLATPQRLMAKSFIESIQPWVIQSHEAKVHNQLITIFLLRQ